MLNTDKRYDEETVNRHIYKMDQRQESPLDVLSRAASMIQKESSGINEVNKSKDGKETNFITVFIKFQP